jgi:hypothetical protein
MAIDKLPIRFRCRSKITIGTTVDTVRRHTYRKRHMYPLASGCSQCTLLVWLLTTVKLEHEFRCKYYKYLKLILGLFY